MREDGENNLGCCISAMIIQDQRNGLNLALRISIHRLMALTFVALSTQDRFLLKTAAFPRLKPIGFLQFYQLLGVVHISSWSSIMVIYLDLPCSVSTLMIYVAPLCSQSNATLEPREPLMRGKHPETPTFSAEAGWNTDSNITANEACQLAASQWCCRTEGRS